MGMDLERKVYSTSPEYFIADTVIPIATSLKEAGEGLKAHAPVALTTENKLAAVTTKNIANLYGLVPDAATAGEDAVVYLTGDFFADSLALEEGVTTADVEIALRKIGIFLK